MPAPCDGLVVRLGQANGPEMQRRFDEGAASRLAHVGGRNGRDRVHESLELEGVDGREQTGRRKETLTDKAYWLAFRHVAHIGPIRFLKLRDQFGSMEAAWHAPDRELRSVLDERSAASLISTRQRVSPEGELERISQLGIEIITLDEASYPSLLAHIPVPPPVLFVKGSLSGADGRAISIVGTRRATSYGRQVTTQLASELARAGLTIVSGLARGIDGIAHREALSAGGRTIAVLASGVDIIYPPEHRQLAEQVVDSGALVSDYPPGTKPDAPNFPARNRLISGLSVGTIVVEAPLRSGAMFTANFAADQGREVFAVPGSILSAASAGTNRLLREGCRLATSAAEILEDLGMSEQPMSEPVQAPLALSEEEERLFAMVGREPQHIDELTAAAGLSSALGAALMTMLELKGFVENAGSQHYIAASRYR
jgi:DNA processing protein